MNFMLFFILLASDNILDIFNTRFEKFAEDYRTSLDKALESLKSGISPLPPTQGISSGNDEDLREINRLLINKLSEGFLERAYEKLEEKVTQFPVNAIYLKKHLEALSYMANKNADYDRDLLYWGCFAIFISSDNDPLCNWGRFCVAKSCGNTHMLNRLKTANGEPQLNSLITKELAKYCVVEDIIFLD